jgi:hypothetical protein
LKHARPDYNRIQDPALQDPLLLGAGSTPIGEDEPVMLFRAQDRLFISVLHHYAARLQNTVGVDPAMVEAVERQIEAARTWQAEHGCKTPDIP